MGSFSAMNIAATGMTAQQLRIDIVSQNIANANSTRGEDGNVYRRKTVVMAEKRRTAFGNVLETCMGQANSGVKVTGITTDMSDLKMVYDPDHPDADENGYVSYPNVDTVQEMTDMIDASRSFEANVTAFQAAKSMASKGLEIMQA
ncbi:MAG: flagellar basal body rod protein FlgC [Lachnospiraceae bacterium]|nr:flagellar basal body rod protein FlgC [Lachnospiraceae bacterium]